MDQKGFFVLFKDGRKACSYVAENDLVVKGELWSSVLREKRWNLAKMEGTTLG
jgi:hypothetical protein